MKRILATLCALTILMAGTIPTLAAETGKRPADYPISVNEYTYGSNEELRIEKVYQLSLSDDPSLIPTADFVRNGQQFTLLDMTRKDEVGVDTKQYTKTISLSSETNDMKIILPRLESEMEATTEDGYSGLLRLDHTSVQVKVNGYATKTQNHTASRSYPNLSDADLSLLPKTVEDKGRTLTLEDVQWESGEQTDGNGNVVTRYTASANYTGTSSHQVATGYTVTADYTGEVAKTNCDVVTYTAIFGSTQAAGENIELPVEIPEQAKPFFKSPIVMGGAALLVVGGAFALYQFKKRR